MRLAPILAFVLLAAALSGPLRAEPAVSLADQARAFLTDYFGPEQQPPRRAQRRLEGWMTSRFASLWKRAQERGQRIGEPFPEADPILNAQDSDRPGDIRIEGVAGTPDRPAVRVSFKVFIDQPERTTVTLVFAEDRGEWRLFDVLTPVDGAAEPASLRRSTEGFVSPPRQRR